jgi:ribosomal protein L37AE/L43A
MKNIKASLQIRKEAVRLYKTGLSIHEVGRKLDCSGVAVWRWFNELPIRIIRRKEKREWNGHDCDECGTPVVKRFARYCGKCGNLSKFHMGDKSPLWIADRTKLKKYDDKRSTAYIYWSRDIRKRDNNTCRINNTECKGKTQTHHILSWTDYPELRYDLNNGITLCCFHHPTTREKGNKMSPYFQDIINNLINK